MIPLRNAEQDVLVVVGDADMATATWLHDQLIQALPCPPRPVLVELGALLFCDLHGLDALHRAATAAHDAGVHLSFRGMSSQLSWLHHTFPPAAAGPAAPGSGAGASTATRTGASC